jgi:hypothetical protein
MAQQDLITIHHVDTWNNQIAPHEDLVGMFQLVCNDRKITIVTKEPGKPPELIEMLLFSQAELDQTHIFGLQLVGDEIKVYRLTAPTVDHTPAAPITQPRNVGPGVVVTENNYPIGLDPKEWSRRYHVELDRTVVRQTSAAVVVEYDLQGLTPQDPVNFSIEPKIRGEEIQYHKTGSGALTITLLRNEMMYRVKQENVRSDGSQDNHDFYIPALVPVKDLPSVSSDIPAVKLRCDDGSQLPTEISLNHVIKQTILDAITDIDIQLSTDLTEERSEKLTLKLTFKQLNPDNTEVTPRRFKEAQIHLQSLITHWGEIEGVLADQSDLKYALDAKANIVFNFTKPDGATVDLDMPEVPPLIDEKVTLHNADETAHPFILDKIEQDIAVHDADETAHPFLLQETAEAKQQITSDIAAHNADASSHTPLRQDLQSELDVHLGAHNAGADSHQNIQTSWNNRLEDHNQDPLEDQHPLIRSQIAAIQTAMLPDPRTLPNGNYLINVAGGVVTLVPAP